MTSRLKWFQSGSFFHNPTGFEPASGLLRR